MLSGVMLIGMSMAACCAPAGAPAPESKKPNAEADERPGASIKPLTKEQQEKLLEERLDVGIGRSFGQYAKGFLVMSRLKLPYGVALMASSQEIAGTELQQVFPKFYKPTLREFLDVIALETSSKWKYDPTGKYFRSDVPRGPVDDLAMFEFTCTKREKPYHVTVPKGWKSMDKGHWTMYIPPSFPVGMDIYELGSYSSDDKTQEKELFERVRTEVALEWAKLAKDRVDRNELKPARVGPYDALYFETMMPLRTGVTMRWRHWVFMVESKCYCVVSTILPQLEDEIFPDVEAMVKSFRIKGQE